MIQQLIEKRFSEQEIEHNYRHNSIVNVLMVQILARLQLIAPGVILPLYVSHFTSNTLVIGIVAVVSAMGYFFPQLSLQTGWRNYLARK